MTDIITSELYDDAYCKMIDAKEWRHRLTPPTVKVLYDHFKPTSVVDVGCANGLHLKAFKELGVERLLGIEGTKHWAPYIEKYFDSRYVIEDLRKPLNPLEPKFDLVFCVEVLEHLEEKYAEQAVKNLIGMGDTLCISACPLTGGFHHVNVKPRRYWINLFKEHGVNYCNDEVDKLQSIFKKMNCSGWFKTGLKVFRNGTK